MKKAILIFMFVLGINITSNSQSIKRLDLTTNIPQFITDYETNLSITLREFKTKNYFVYWAKDFVLNFSYEHYKNFDNFMFGLGYEYITSSNLLLEPGIKFGIGGGELSNATYIKIGMPINNRTRILILPRYCFNKIGNYPEIKLGLSINLN
ncbi:hypothetical protein GW932_01420 [archaeon]|nr:hypothetical protein [archaeon]